MAERANCVVPDDLVFKDAGISGMTKERPGFQALLRLIPQRRFGVVFIEAADASLAIRPTYSRH